MLQYKNGSKALFPSKRPCFVINIIDLPPQMRNSQTVHTFGFRLWTLLTKWLKPHRCFCALFQVVHFICVSGESNSQIAKGLQGLHFGVCGKHSLSTCPGSFALCFCFGRRLCKDLADGGKVEHQRQTGADAPAHRPCHPDAGGAQRGAAEHRVQPGTAPAGKAGPQHRPHLLPHREPCHRGQRPGLLAG